MSAIVVTAMPANDSSKPITERDDDITTNIDVSSIPQMIRLLFESDSLIFGGYKHFRSLWQFENELERAIAACVAVLRDVDRGCVIMSGCGTSGRLGYVAAQTFNRIATSFGLTHNPFKYLLAGGDAGLFQSLELCEDDPTAGVTDLVTSSQGLDRVVYIGITCGLSAPYVAGQLEHARKNSKKFFPVLIGFNPDEYARDVTIEKWTEPRKTFRDVLNALRQDGSGCVINPVYGPEPITGSSRMKGGTTTLALLDAIFTCALLRMRDVTTRVQPREIFNAVQALQESTFLQHREVMTPAVEACSHALRNGGHIYYVSSDNDVSPIGLIDASECAPTFGANMDDVRGFVAGGYASLDTNDADKSQFIDVNESHFLSKVLPDVTRDDVICVLQHCSESGERLIRQSKAVRIYVTLAEERENDVIDDDAICVDLVLPNEKLEQVLSKELCVVLRPIFRQLVCKWLCNTLTTCAHVHKGKVFRNKMIDLRVRNDKLFRRAITTITDVTKCDAYTAQTCLLRAIYDTDDVTEATRHQPVSAHVARASDKEQVLPVAILMAASRCTVSEAKKRLERTPILREAIAHELPGMP